MYPGKCSTILTKFSGIVEAEYQRCNAKLWWTVMGCWWIAERRFRPTSAKITIVFFLKTKIRRVMYMYVEPHTAVPVHGRTYPDTCSVQIYLWVG
eukprot:SAG31_NODE_9742_length_1234_cov_1.139207_1_plen_94_part_10